MGLHSQVYNLDNKLNNHDFIHNVFKIVIQIGQPALLPVHAHFFVLYL